MRATLSHRFALPGRSRSRDRRGSRFSAHCVSGRRFYGGILQPGVSRRGRARRAAHPFPGISLRKVLGDPNSCAFRYTAADLLTLPTIAAPLVIQREGEAPAGQAAIAEAMLSMGCLWPGQWNGDLLGTMQECFHLWCERLTGREDGLKALEWWKFFLLEDLEACSEIYDPKSDREDIRKCRGLVGKPLAALALCAASDRHIKLGDVLTRLAGHLRFAGIRPDPALANLMGPLNRAVAILGGWTPVNCRAESERWYEEQSEDDPEDYFDPDKWKSLPNWLFSTEYSVASLRRLEKKLRTSERDLSLCYWTMARALELGQALDALVACKEYADYSGHLSYSMTPGLALLWNRANEPDILSDFADFQWECLVQSESHGVQWLYAFDPTNPESCGRAGRVAQVVLRLIGSLDLFLTELDAFAKSGPRYHEVAGPRLHEGARIRV